ncbi:MAG: cysteine-rich CWC family protein [Sulfuritalea sp.]|nr:cysteine-rich CWC family protein [Sulfuritalea sp.]
MRAGQARTISVCPQCGKAFRCGMECGDAECWCAALPPLMAVPAPAGTGATVPACLCPDCLSARLSPSAGEPGRDPL